MNARRILSGTCLAFGLLAGMTACSPQKTLRPNAPPETILFVRGPVDPVNHVVRLYWFGSDPDGYVTGYELRLLNPAAPADSAWIFTTVTDSLFTVYTPSGVTAPVLEVRAIDDAGERDPEPARQDFTFNNQAPTVTIQSRLGATDTTFATMTLFWSASDPDGDAAKLRFRVWLDRNEANADTVSGASYTLPARQFVLRDSLLAGPRTAFIQPIDDGGRVGVRDSMTWFVAAPVPGGLRWGTLAPLLLLDDLPNNNTPNRSYDGIMNATAQTKTSGRYSWVRLERTQPFRSSADVAGTLGLFQAVLYYRGEPAAGLRISTILRDYEDGFRDYLNAGGNLYLESYNLIDGLRASGQLSESFMRDHLGSDFLFLNFTTTTTFSDSCAAWGTAGTSTGVPLDASPLAPGETLLVPGLPASLRAFGVRSGASIAVWAPAGGLAPANPIPMAVGLKVPQGAGGTAIAMALPLRAAVNLSAPGTVNRVVARIMDILLGAAPFRLASSRVVDHRKDHR